MRRAAVAAVLLLAFGAGTLEAQFGRNKVQYRSFDFDIIRTEHFDVHFYPQEREAAMDGARMAERSYGRLSRLLRHEFRERKPIILYASHAHFQQTNALPGLIDEGTGGVTEALKSRVILPFTGSYPDFDHVLTHELVHAFQFDIIFRHGVMTETGPSVGRIPLWFMEGMAEYLALGRIDAHTASWVRDAAIKGYIRSIGEMNRRDDYLSYRFGQSLWAYIGATWGDEVIGVLLQKAPRVGVDRAFASTLGITLEELSRDWLSAVRETHLPTLVAHAGPESFSTRLTQHEEIGDPWYLGPALSPDGETLVFASQRDGFFMDLWLADGRTGEVRDKLIEGSRSSGFESLRYQSSAGSFSPDGRHVAFSAQSGGRDVLYIYDVARRRVARKLELDLDGINNPAWSPDGRRLVFSGIVGGLSDLFITDLDGETRRLTDDRYADLQPSWSPDGATIAFSSDRGPGADMERLRYGNFRVATLDIRTGDVRVLPHQTEGKNINPVWSPDGRTLAWVGDRTGVNNLYLFDLERDELRQATDVLTGIIGTNHLTPVLSWARESGRMAFVHFESGGYNIYALDDPLSLPTIRVWSGPPVIAAAPDPAPLPEAAEPEPQDPRPQEAEPNVTEPNVTEPVEPAPSPASGSSFSASYYRSGSRFRPSHDVPLSALESAGPMSVSELLDSAGLELPDTASFRVEDYRVKLSPDLVGRPTVGVSVGGYYGNGLYGGSYVSMSDMLGNHNMVLAGNINGSLSDAMFYGGYGFYKRRANLGLALQQMPFYRYRGIRQFDMELDGEARPVRANVFLRDVIRSAQGTVAYPFSTFRRVELGASAAYFKRDYLYRGYTLDTNEPLLEDRRVGDLAYVEPSLALVFDNALFGWTGPIQGRRYRLQVSRTYGNLSYTEGLVDLRNYLNHDGWLVLATRFVGLARTGPDSDRFSLFWGGPYFIRGYDGHTFDTRSEECTRSREVDGGLSESYCPVRDQLIGSSGAFLNTELRFPVITELRLGPLGQFPPVDGVFFFDAGLAWDERVCSTRDFDPTTDCGGTESEVHLVLNRKPGQDPYLWREPLYSYGLGVRINVFYAILRLEYAFPMDRDRNGLFRLAFGPSF